jgi:hypothetical protein
MLGQARLRLHPRHVDRLFAAGAPAVGTDPDPANARAIAPTKAGFAARDRRHPLGPSLLMTRYARMTEFSPREIVSELDRFIVGHADAKRAVAIALRNRWRRGACRRTCATRSRPRTS